MTPDPESQREQSLKFQPATAPGARRQARWEAEVLVRKLKILDNGVGVPAARVRPQPWKKGVGVPAARVRPQQWKSEVSSEPTSEEVELW